MLGSARESFHLWDEPQVLLAALLEDCGCRTHQAAAISLLRECGSISKVLMAPWRTLRRHAGWRAAAKLRRLPAHRLEAVRQRADARPLLDDRRKLQQFVKELSPLKPRGLVAMYVDSELRLVKMIDADAYAFDTRKIDIAGPMWRGASIGAAGFFLIRFLKEGDRHCPEFRTVTNNGPRPDGSLPLIAQLLVEEGEIHFVGGLNRHQA